MKKGKKSFDHEIAERAILSIPQYAFVNGDDWQGFYVDGRLVAEGHSIRIEDLFKHAGVSVQFLDADLEWLGSVGSLPETLSEVQVDNE